MRVPQQQDPIACAAEIPLEQVLENNNHPEKPIALSIGCTIAATIPKIAREANNSICLSSKAIIPVR